MADVKGARLLILLAVAGLLPTRALPGDFPVPKIRFQSVDGVTLSGHRFGRGTDGVILAHRFPTDQISWFPFAESIQARDWTALTFDFRGYGTSDGEREIAKIDRDLAGAVHYARGSGAKRIILIGASMGGTAALKVSAAEPVDGVVVLSPSMAFLGLSSEEDLPKIRAPKFFLVSEVEMNVPVQSVRRQFKSAPEPKRLEVVPDSAHGSRMLDGEQGKRIQGGNSRICRLHFRTATSRSREARGRGA